MNASILQCDQKVWGGSQFDATSALECGQVLVFPDLAFEVHEEERVFFSGDILTAKNVSFDPRSGRISGTTVKGRQADSLRALLQRFGDCASLLVEALLPCYRGHLERARTSFRAAEMAARETSWRYDDKRLHVDSFAATPVQDRRILRVFSNVNPQGRPRTWRLGEPFERVVARFGPTLPLPATWRGTILTALRIIQGRRTPYDALMLQLHDRMKLDAAYQMEAPQTAIDFAAGSTWMAYTDQVSHAATAGQYALEQTFLLPVAAMREPERSPQRILERLKGRPLV